MGRLMWLVAKTAFVWFYHALCLVAAILTIILFFA